MSVLLNAAMLDGRKIVVDDVHNILHIDATGHNSSSDQDGRNASSKGAESMLTLKLGPVGMDGSDRKTNVVAEAIEVVNFRASVAENDGAVTSHVPEQTQDVVSLLRLLTLDNLLLDVLSGTASATNAEANVVSR